MKFERVKKSECFVQIWTKNRKGYRYIQKVKVLHYLTLDHITSYYIILHYITLDYIPLITL